MRYDPRILNHSYSRESSLGEMSTEGYNILEKDMPRQIDLECQQCGFIEEVQKEVEFFVDDELTPNPCPRCEFPFRSEIPASVSIHMNNKAELPLNPKRPKRLTPEGIMPDDVRQAFAKELFDPCSCGDHSPADLDDHEKDCHNRLHTFVKKTSEDKKTA